MKHCLIIFGLMFLTLTQAFAKNLTDLESLPSAWQGVAGDLVVRETASFRIDKSKLLDAKPGAIEKNYEVTASLIVGSRTVSVYKVSLQNSSDNSSGYKTVEMTIFCNDDLVPIIWVSIVFNKTTNTYTMQDFISPGLGRRIVLHGI
jgi:hypothetical protein